jgi:molybdate transport system ATP-binding protein
MFYQQRYYEIESTDKVTVRHYLSAALDKLQSLQLPHSFQINQLLDLELSRLSNGQVKKIVILKRLLDSMPRILLLDYPFEGLDAKSRYELSDFLDHISEVHCIQLIIADHVHPELPKSISKKVTLNESSTVICDFKNEPVLLSDGYQFNVQATSKNTEPIVEMLEVKIQYHQKVLIENLNWRINRGERWALTGRNGSGKTTLFSLIYADHPIAYSEKVYLFGKRRGTGESIWDIKKRISYLGPELLHFLDHATSQLSVLEYLQKNKPLQEKLIQLISLFEIQEILSKKLRHLSNGELQLILLLALFLSQKELLLLDEPFQFLDPVQKRRVNEYLLSHLDQSTTLVLITHYESDVAMWTHQRLDLNR